MTQGIIFKTILYAQIIFIGLTINCATLVGQSSNSCLNFDGLDDYISVASDPVDQLGTGDFTVEAWIRGDEASQNVHPTIFSNRASGAYGDGVTFGLHGPFGGTAYRVLFLQIGCANYLLATNGGLGSILDNDCHHVAISKQGDTLSFYIDGSFLGTRTICASASTVSTTPLLIGRDGPTGNEFNGTISDVMIWNTTRTPIEIQSDMQGSTSPLNPALLAYYEMNEGSGQLISDQSTYAANGELGSTSSTDGQDPAWGTDCCLPKVDPSCLSFDGTDDYVSIASDPVSQIGTSNFTLEAWIRGDEASQNLHPTVLSNRASSAYGDGVTLGFHGPYGGTTYRVLFLQIGCANYLLSTNGGLGSILDNTCHHVAISKQGDTLSFYIDGNFLGTRTICASASTVSTAPLLIGRDAPTGNEFNGTISDVMIWNTFRTAAEIQTDMLGSTSPLNPALLAYYEMHEGSGQLVSDQSTYAAHGELGSTGIPDNQDPSWGAYCCINPICNAAISPQNFTATYSGATVDFSWDPVPGSVGCQVKIGEFGSGFPNKYNLIGYEVSAHSLPVDPNMSQEFQAKVRCACSLSPVVATPFSSVAYFALPSARESSTTTRQTEVTLFPNPAKEVINLKLDLVESATVQISDMSGNELIARSVSGGTTQVDIRTLANGIYMLKVTTAEDTAVRKFEVLK